MQTFTEGPHAGEFILSEANHFRSRDNGVVKSGENLAAGELCQLDGTEYIAWDGSSEGVAAIIIYPTNASSTGTNAATPAAFLTRDAEVNGNCLVYPSGEETAAVAGLLALGIIVR